jgi:tetratricopeptide (TPR) repeat protein
MIFESEALMRFGRWQEVLVAPEPKPGLPLSKALWHYTRACANIALNRLEDARSEKAAFETASAAVPKGWRFGNNSAADILAIASRVVEGELLAKEGKLEAALSSLREAATLEDTLQYDEPPDWIQPVRHTLGAVLLKTGQPAEAEKAYRADLEKYPGNGWSLMGLRDALRQQGKEAEARVVDAKFKTAWAGADIKPTVSCYCQQAP